MAEKQESGQGVTGQLAVLTPCTHVGKRAPDTSHGPSSSGCEGEQTRDMLYFVAKTYRYYEHLWQCLSLSFSY